MKRLETIDGIMDLLNVYNIIIKESQLNGSCRGFICKYKLGYCVLIEEALCFDCKLNTLRHELCHILLGHLDDDIKSEEEKESEVAEYL